MTPRKRERRFIAVAGAAALVAVGLNLAFSAVAAHRRRKRRELPGFTAQVNLSAAEIKRLADRIIAKSKDTYDSVAAIPLDKVSFANAIAPLAELDALQFPLVQACLLPRMVSPSEDVRRASVEAEKQLDSHFMLCSNKSPIISCKVTRQREDVYRVIKAFTGKGERIGPEATRFVQCLVKEFERNGAKLTQSKRKEMEILKSRIDTLNLKYIQNLNDFTKYLLLREDELAGMPLEFLQDLEKVDGKLKVLLTSYHVTPILEHCKVGSTRKSIAVAYGQKGGKENLGILENLVQLRHRLARLLGYPNYSDFAIEPRMPRTSRKVLEFLEEMSEQLTEIANRELSILKDLKMKEEGDTQFGMEDLLYYIKRAEELKVDLDIGEIKQYFPVSLVIPGMMKMFQDLFALRFEEIKDAEVWHDTVRVFSVWDASSSDLLGYFFLDIFSRFRLLYYCLNAQKILMGIQHYCGSLKLSSYSMNSVMWSIIYRIEPPSQDFLVYDWKSMSLKMMSGFHQDITKSITSEACQSLKRRRDLFAGLKIKQEILLCLVDQIIHSSENVDIDGLLKDLHPKVMLGIPLLEGTSPASCFPRIVVGYDAVCYSYIWSEVFATDLFVSKFKDDLLNQHAGLRFRNKVLAPGGSKDPLDIITDYLGREPSLQPFIQSKKMNSL
ncbi:hypothetical protein ACP4OV_030164 [Aristida adscensionis]